MACLNRSPSLSGALRPKPHVLQANDAVGMRSEALDLLGHAPEPLVVVEKDVRPVIEVDLRCCCVIQQAKRRVGLAPCCLEMTVKLLVAVFAPIKKSVAREPDTDVAVGVGTAGPDHERRFVIAIGRV